MAACLKCDACPSFSPQFYRKHKCVNCYCGLVHHRAVPLGSGQPGAGGLYGPDAASAMAVVLPAAAAASRSLGIPHAPFIWTRRTPRSRNQVVELLIRVSSLDVSRVKRAAFGDQSTLQRAARRVSSSFGRGHVQLSELRGRWFASCTVHGLLASPSATSRRRSSATSRPSQASRSSNGTLASRAVTPVERRAQKARAAAQGGAAALISSTRKPRRTLVGTMLGTRAAMGWQQHVPVAEERKKGFFKRLAGKFVNRKTRKARKRIAGPTQSTKAKAKEAKAKAKVVEKGKGKGKGKGSSGSALLRSKSLGLLTRAGSRQRRLATMHEADDEDTDEEDDDDDDDDDVEEEEEDDFAAYDADGDLSPTPVVDARRATDPLVAEEEVGSLHAARRASATVTDSLRTCLRCLFARLLLFGVRVCVLLTPPRDDTQPAPSGKARARRTWPPRPRTRGARRNPTGFPAQKPWKSTARRFSFPKPLRCACRGRPTSSKSPT